jgi:hypothetical protein
MSRIKTAASLIVLFFFLMTAVAKDIDEAVEAISIDYIMQTLEYLTSEECEGRLTGSVGYTKAALWCADEFKKMGALPVYDNYLQSFPIAYNETGESSFAVTIPAEKEGSSPDIKEFEALKDYLPFLSGGFGEAEAEIVFAGHGTTAPELGWDDYEGLDVKGKIVAVFYGAPKIKGKNFNAYNNNIHRSENAYKRGAVGFITITNTMAISSTNFIENFPMIVARETFAELILNNKGYDLETVKNLLTNGIKVSFPTGIKAKIKCTGIHHANATGYNVVAYFPGSDPKLKKEYILFGGHLDHMGKWPVLFPGANDNASGSAIILEIARAYASLDNKPKRSVMFALFGAEESGLNGSEFMAQHLPSELKMIQMINIDSNGIGNGLWITGIKTYKELYAFIEKAKKDYDIKSSIEGSEIAPDRGMSDYSAFLNMGIPSWANWTRGGKGGGYHDPNDTIYYITPKIMQDVAKLYFAASYEFLDKKQE